MIAASLLGRISLPAGVVGHEGSTLLVTLSGLRLLFQLKDSRALRVVPAGDGTAAAL